MQTRYVLHRQCIGVHCLYDVRSLGEVRGGAVGLVVGRVGGGGGEGLGKTWLSRRIPAC